MEEPTNAVLGVKLDLLRDENTKEHTAILEQTSKTNGRVTRLEKTKNMLVGGLVFMNVIAVPIVVAVILEFLIKH